MADRFWFTTILVCLGAVWALTHPLIEIVVAAGYQPLGIMFWQLLIGAILTGAVLLIRREPLPITLQAIGFWLVIALVGTLLPNHPSLRA